MVRFESSIDVSNLTQQVRTAVVGEQLRYGPDLTANYWSHTVSATGDLALTGVGSTGGAFGVTPAAGKNVDFNLSGAAVFKINTNVSTFSEQLLSTAAASVSNTIKIDARLDTSTQTRVAWRIGGGFTNITDASKESYFAVEVNSGGSFSEVARFASGSVIIGGTTPLAKFHVSQSSTTAAIPVLRLGQSDLSEEMIRFNSTVGVGNPIEAVGAKVLTVTHYVRMFIEGVGARYLALGTIA